MSHYIPRHHCPGLAGTVYVLTFKARDWRFLLAEIDGVAIWDEQANAGLLGGTSGESWRGVGVRAV